MQQREFLRKQMLKKTREQINEKFAGKEIHIIKAINLLTDLDSINNLLKENQNEWSNRQPTGNAEKEFKILQTSTTQIEEEKKSLNEFITNEMNLEFPNFSTLATPIIGAKLLASAGSKKKLCFSPASTIQVLGAEKALFAHIKTHAKSPKHGHLFNHPLMQKLPRFKRGRVARIIAGKLAIALKQDYFEGENTSKEDNEELKKQIEKIATEPITENEARKEKELTDAEISEKMRKEFLAKQNPKDRKLFIPQQDIIEINRKRTIRRGNDKKRIFGGKEKENESIDKRKGFESQRRFEKRNENNNIENESEVIQDQRPQTHYKREFTPRFGVSRHETYGNDRGRSFSPSRFGSANRNPRFQKRTNYGERKPFGQRPSYSGGERSYNDRTPSRENRSFGERKPFNNRPPFGERQDSEYSQDGETQGQRYSRQGRFGKPKFRPKRFSNNPHKKAFKKRF